MNNAASGVVAAPRPRGPYETIGFEVDDARLARLAEHLATRYPTSDNREITERIATIQREEAIALLGGAAHWAVQLAGESSIKNNDLLRDLQENIKAAADQELLAQEVADRPLEGTLQLPGGSEVAFENIVRTDHQDRYVLSVSSSHSYSGDWLSRQEDVVSMQLIDNQARPELHLPAASFLDEVSYNERKFKLDAHGKEYLAEMTRAQRQTRDRDYYDWNSYWLQEPNGLFDSWQTYKLRYNEDVHDYILELIVREACVKHLTVSLCGETAYLLYLAHHTPPETEEAEALFDRVAPLGGKTPEFQADSSIGVYRHPSYAPDSLNVTFWQKGTEGLDGDADAFGDILGTRTRITIDAQDRAAIRGEWIMSNPLHGLLER